MPDIAPVSKLLDSVLEDIYEGLVKSAAISLGRHAQAMDLFQRARQRYFDTLETQYGNIRILGMSAPMPIDSLFIPVRVTEEGGSRRYMDSKYMEYINRQKRVPSAIAQELTRSLQGRSSDAIGVVEGGSYFVLLGGPGSGKTTLMRHLALLYCGRTPALNSSVFTPRFPVLVSLREGSAAGGSLHKMLLEPLVTARIPEPDLFLERLLDKGACAVLLDGFDELPEPRQVVLVQQLRDLIARHPKNKYIVSSRIAEPLQPLEQFHEIQVCEFGPVQVAEFTSRWFQGTRPNRGKELADKIAQDLHLTELATTPLLLSLICILYRYDLRIPTNRSELYDRCVECLLREWDASRGFRRQTSFERFSDARKMQFLSQLAHDLFISERILFPEAAIQSVLKPYLLRLGCTEDDAGPVLQEMLHHHGLLVERAPGVFSFSHLTFQEFFVARYLVTTNTMSVLPDYVASPRWQEVITLSANMLPDASELVLAILERIDTTKMRGIAKRGDLGYEGVLLRSLCLSEAVLSQSVRSPLHRLYLDQHTRVNKIPWESIDLSWRYSKKAGKTMANVGFPKVVRDDVRLTEAMHAFRTTLDTLSLSMPLLRSFEAGYAPKDPGAKAAFASFVHMTTDIVDNGGMYSIRIV